MQCNGNAMVYLGRAKRKPQPPAAERCGLAIVRVRVCGHWYQLTRPTSNMADNGHVQFMDTKSSNLNELLTLRWSDAMYIVWV